MRKCRDILPCPHAIQGVQCQQQHKERNRMAVQEQHQDERGNMLRSNAITIGQLSQRTSVPIKVLRHYEDLGFLYTLGRSESNYRFRRYYTVYCPLNAIDLVERRYTRT